MNNKAALLEKLCKEMSEDARLPLKKGANKLVFGNGNADAKILLIGEGPGFWEDQKGEPFVGRAGALLTLLLKTVGLGRGEVFITNIVHHRPPQNRDPLPEEIESYGKYLDRIIGIVSPKLIITLGRFSMAKFLPGVKISLVHGKDFTIDWEGRKVIIVPIYHPAAALRNPAVKLATFEDFKKLKSIIKSMGDANDRK